MENKVKKPCITCKQVKDRSEFYNNHGYADGKRSECKDCCKQRAAKRVEGKKKDQVFI